VPWSPNVAEGSFVIAEKKSLNDPVLSETRGWFLKLSLRAASCPVLASAKRTGATGRVKSAVGTPLKTLRSVESQQAALE
jgi:hypothetical protein